MPKMGRAPQYTKNSANDARIARESMAQKQKKLQNRLKQQKGGKPQDPTKAVKEGTSYDNKLVDNLTGYREKTVYRNGPHNQMGKNEFLKLLSHQLRNQDPMNPMDQNKFSAELAQFAQLEQLSNLNTKFDKMNPNVNTEDKFYGASFLGKEVITSGTTVNYKGGGDKADLYFNLAEPADKMVLRIIDKNGNIVNEFWREKMSAGAHKLYWDGYDLAGNPENAGEFNIKVQAWDQTGAPITAKTQVQGKVESVYFENGETVLIVDGKKVFLRDVDSFHVPREKNQKIQANNPSNLQRGKVEQAAPSIRNANAGKPMQSALPKASGNTALNSYKNNAPIDLR